MSIIDLLLSRIVKLAAWSDVVAKAKRLIKERRVTILRNAPTHVMAHVIGDHGEYMVEISRHDPKSAVIEMWSCQCLWSQYAFDRTRKWKHLEARPCSHVLATYWKARATPIDVEETEEGWVVPRGQKPPETMPGQQRLFRPERVEPEPVPEEKPTPPPEEPVSAPPPEEVPERPQVPEEAPTTPQAPQPAPLPATTQLVVGPQPVSPFTIPKPPTTRPRPKRRQLRLFDITKPEGVQEQPATTPVSVPGAKQPTPDDPIILPGTFSSYMPVSDNIPVIALNTSNFIYASSELEDYFEAQRLARRPIYVQILRDVMLELTGGKIPVPGAMPYDYTKEGVPLYKVMDLGYNPQTKRREKADVNQLQGAPAQTGTYAYARAGMRGEVLDYDSNLKMAYVYVPLHYEPGLDVRLHPHGLKGWVDFKDLKPSFQDPARHRKRRSVTFDSAV